MGRKGSGRERYIPSTMFVDMREASGTLFDLVRTGALLGPVCF